MLSYLKKLLFGVKEQEEKPLNFYKYKFLRYKEERENKYPLDLSRVYVPQQNDLVSVILPVYNGGDILADSIKSVLRQTYEYFELIIINDGSKDDTLKVAQSFAEKDSRIRVLTQENKKIPRTLSRGFREARGEFLTWTSADNVMDANFLEKMVAEMKSDPQTAMVWGNMRLINAKGKKYNKHGWYEFPIGSGNVIFPNDAYELNVYANNTIGAAFMYRKSAAEILGCYSSYRHTLEDYDYWMRMNSLLKLRHTSFVSPIYSYRWHDGSLTAKDKELGITKNRYKLMVYEDFRRDFYMIPVLWYIKSDVNNASEAEKFKKKALETGHIVLEKEDFSHLFFGSGVSNLVYVSFGGEAPDVTLPDDAITVVVNGDNSCGEFQISAHIGEDIDPSVYSFKDTETMFSFMDARAKNDMLYQMEGRVENAPEPERKLSVILCTHKISDTLEDCLEALCNQTANPRDYEIVFVNNNFRNEELKEYVQNFCAKYPNISISYITAPQIGLSYARNCGMWAAKGEYLLYVDDDSIAFPDVFEQTIKTFDEHEDLGTCGGQVILTVPEEARQLVTEKTIGLWSNLEIEGKGFRYAKDYGEFPYGANFAVRAACLRMIGGFRCNYGRVGNNYAGGEETLVSFMMDTLHMKVGLNGDSKVEHRVAPDRFSIEHIEKTTYAGIMTQYRLRLDLYAPLDWTDANVRERASKAAKQAEGETEGSANYVYYNATAKAFRDVAELRRRDYEFINRKQR